jgi:predicted N-acetyltransferase YhbS
MEIKVRQEKPADYSEVFNIIKDAFKSEAISDGTEQYLVERLRKSDSFIPELSLVALVNDKIVGHILLTKIKIENKNESFDSLALAPVSVKPNFQKMGIGEKLIKASHKKAIELGYQSIVLLGHEKYYPRFGYKKASNYNIKIPFDAPDENCMAIELVKEGLKNVNGKVIYSPAFFA